MRQPFKLRAGTHFYRIFYVDAFLFARIDNTGFGLGIVWRAGFISYLNPNRSRRSSLGKLDDNQMWLKLYFKVEGWFASIGAGFILCGNW